MLPIVSRTTLLLCLAGSSWVMARPTGSLRAEEAAPPAVIETIQAAGAPLVEVDPSTALEQLQPEAPALPVTVDSNALPSPATPAAEESALPTFVAPEAELVGEVPVMAETLNAELASTAAPVAAAEEIGYTPADQNPPDQPEPLIVDIPTPAELPVSEIGLPTPVTTEPVVAALPEAPAVEIVEESIPALETPSEVVAESIPAAPVVVEETLPEVAAVPAVEVPAVETPVVETVVVEPVVEALPEAPAVEIVEESIPAVETPSEVVAEAIPAASVVVEETLPEVAAAPAVETPAVETPVVEDPAVETAVVETLPEAPVVEIVEESIPAVETPSEVVAESIPAAPAVVEETLPEVAAVPEVEVPAVETPLVETPAVESVVEAVPAAPAVETVPEPVVMVDSLPSTGDVVSEEPVVIAPVAEPVFTDISQETDFLPLPTFPVEAVVPTPDPRVEASPTVVSEVVPVDTPAEISGAEIPATPAVEVPAETSVFEVLRSEDLDTTPVAEGAPQIDAPLEVIPPLPEVSEIPAAESALPEVLAEAPLGCQPPAEGVVADPEIAPSVDAPAVVIPAPESTESQPGIATEIREVVPGDECPSAPELPVDAGDELSPVPVEVNLPLELFDSL
jgi:hypothetical protein